MAIVTTSDSIILARAAIGHNGRTDSGERKLYTLLIGQMLEIIVTKLSVIVVIVIDVYQRRQVGEVVIRGVIGCAGGTRMTRRTVWHEVRVREARIALKGRLIGRENRAGAHLKVRRR